MIYKMLVCDINSILNSILNSKVKNPEQISNLELYPFKNNPYPELFLEENCNLLKNNLLNKGKKLSVDDTKTLEEFGFHFLWVRDNPISENQKKNDFVYTLKNEFYKTLKKYMIPLNEKYAQKPGSHLNYMDPNDLLKRTIEPIQLEGAKYLAQNIFGESFQGIKHLKDLIHSFYQNPPQPVHLYSHVSFGNLYHKTNNLKENNTLKNKKEPSNYIIESMINISFGFMATLSKLQKLRLDRDPESHLTPTHKRKINLRYAYTEDEMMEASLAAIFCEYGLLHFTINKTIQSITRSFVEHKFRNPSNYEENGFIKLGETSQLIYDKHCNVGYNLFNSIPRPAHFVDDIARGILQYHHSTLNGMGYPKRKIITEKILQKTSVGLSSIKNHKVYEYPIAELTRLAHIVNFFVEYSLHSPLHLPFNRDSLVRHLLINSVFPNDSSGQKDHLGIYDLDTKKKLPYRFDGYLVNCFLQSIHLYKIGECIPIYHFNNDRKKLFDAVIVEYNDMPHRPVIKSLEGKLEGKKINLSSLEYDSLYIGEYTPALYFQDVLNLFHSSSNGVLLQDQLENTQNSSYKNKVVDTIDLENTQQNQKIDIDHLLQDIPDGLKQLRKKDLDNDHDLKSENVNVKSSEAKAESLEMLYLDEIKVQEKKVLKDKLCSIFLKQNNKLFPYALGKLITSVGAQEKKIKLTHIARLTNTFINHDTYTYSAIAPDLEEVISIPSIKKPNQIFLEENPQFIIESELEEVEKEKRVPKILEVGEYHLLLYFESKDTKKAQKKDGDFQDKKDSKNEGTTKYIITIKEINTERIIVTFLRYIQILNQKVSYLKDKNCGKNFDLNRFSFFKIGRLLSAKEVIQFLNLSVF